MRTKISSREDAPGAKSIQRADNYAMKQPQSYNSYICCRSIFSRMVCNGTISFAQRLKNAKTGLLARASDFFERLGYFVYDHPWKFILLPILLCCICSLGFLNRVSELNMGLLYSIPVSPTTIAESELARAFPVERVNYVFAVDKNAGGLFTKQTFKHLDQFWTKVTHLRIPVTLVKKGALPGDTSVEQYLLSQARDQITFNPYYDSRPIGGRLSPHRANEEFPSGGSEYLSLGDLCVKTAFGTCQVMNPIDLYATPGQRGTPLRTNTYPDFINFRSGTGYRLDAILGGIVKITYARTTVVSNATAAAFRLTLLGERQTADGAAAWEAGLVTLVENINLPGIKLFVRAERSINDELANTSHLNKQDLLILLCASAVVSCCTIFMNSSWDWYRTKTVGALVGIATTALAYGGGVGIWHMFGMKHVPFAEATPFMILGICVDDVFIILNAYALTYTYSSDARKRIGLSLRDTGVSITITALTNIMAFGLGASSLYFSIHVFCILTASGLFVGYLLCLTVFVGALSLSAKWEQKQQQIESSVCLIERRAIAGTNCLPLESDSFLTPTLENSKIRKSYTGVDDILLVNKKSHGSTAELSSANVYDSDEKVVSPVEIATTECCSTIQTTALTVTEFHTDIETTSSINSLDSPSSASFKDQRDSPHAAASKSQHTVCVPRSIIPTSITRSKSENHIQFIHFDPSKKIVLPSETKCQCTTPSFRSLLFSGNYYNIPKKKMDINSDITPRRRNDEDQTHVTLPDGLHVLDKLDNFVVVRERAALRFKKPSNKNKNCCAELWKFPLSLQKKYPNNTHLRASINNQKNIILPGNNTTADATSFQTHNSIAECTDTSKLKFPIDELPRLAKANDKLLLLDKFPLEPIGTVGRPYRDFFTYYLGPFLLSPVIKAAVLLIFGSFLLFSIYNLTRLEIGLELKEVTPHESYLRQFFEIRESYFSAYGDECVLFFPDKGDWWKTHVQKALKNLNDALENSEHVVYVLNGFEEFMKEYRAGNYTLNSREDFKHAFQRWSATPRGRLLAPMFTVDNNGLITSWKLYYWMKYIDNTRVSISWIEEVRALINQAVNEGTPLAHVFTPLAVHWESDLRILKATITNIISSLSVIGFVSIFLLHGIFSGLLVLITIVVIDIAVVGTMPLIGLKLNVLTLVNLVLSIGFAVDYTVHITYCFTQCKGKTRNKRTLETLILTGLPITEGMVSTYGAILALSASRKYTMVVVFKMLTIVLAYAFAYGVILMPIILSFIGPLEHDNIEVVQLWDSKIAQMWVVDGKNGAVILDDNQHANIINDLNKNTDQNVLVQTSSRSSGGDIYKLHHHSNAV